MTRAVFAIMTGLLCALAGVKHAASLKGTASRLSRWVQVLTHLALLLRQGVLSLPEAMCAAADASLPPDRLLREIAARIHASPLLTLTDAYRQTGAEGAEEELLLRLFARLGRGTKESRVLAAEQTAAEMRLLADEAAAKAAKDARLWQTLGLTGGVCLTILLL